MTFSIWLRRIASRSNYFMCHVILSRFLTTCLRILLVLSRPYYSCVRARVVVLSHVRHICVHYLVNLSRGFLKTSSVVAYYGKLTQ